MFANVSENFNIGELKNLTTLLTWVFLSRYSGFCLPSHTTLIFLCFLFILFLFLFFLDILALGQVFTFLSKTEKTWNAAQLTSPRPFEINFHFRRSRFLIENKIRGFAKIYQQDIYYYQQDIYYYFSTRNLTLTNLLIYLKLFIWNCSWQLTIYLHKGITELNMICLYRIRVGYLSRCPHFCNSMSLIQYSRILIGKLVKDIGL